MVRILVVILALAAASPAHAQSSEVKESPLYQAVEAGKTTRRDVRLLQRLLAIQGYNPGLIDGIFGKKTQEAIAQWQKDTGQRVHGLGLAPGEVAVSDAARRCLNVPQSGAGLRVRAFGGACR